MRLIQMTVLVTGAAGFIGMHTSLALLARGEQVVGVDNLNDYYDPALKAARLDQLTGHAGFSFHKADVSDRDAMRDLIAGTGDVDRVIHLAAQAGVRYSLDHPFEYLKANVDGQLAVLEACRANGAIKHLVYASSSSVYGANTKVPFSIEDRVDSPVSLYAATKRTGELLAYCYGHLFRVPATGLRFFTVYGPWGRPDMSAFLFTKAILEGRPIRVFNNGEMWRDFTYIDDIVAGVLAALDRPPADLPDTTDPAPPQRVYNLGNHRSEKLLDFIAGIEDACGAKATMAFEPMQPGDVARTYADIDASRRDLGFEPRTAISEGIPRFVAWFRDYHGL